MNGNQLKQAVVCVIIIFLEQKSNLLKILSQGTAVWAELWLITRTATEPFCLSNETITFKSCKASNLIFYSLLRTPFIQGVI